VRTFLPPYPGQRLDGAAGQSHRPPTGGPQQWASPDETNKIGEVRVLLRVAIVVAVVIALVAVATSSRSACCGG
jgi:hypothetical protein